MSKFKHIFLNGTRIVYGEVQEELCKQITVSTLFDVSQDFINDIKVQNCPENFQYLFMPKHIPLCHVASCQGILMLPHDKASLPTFLSVKIHTTDEITMQVMDSQPFAIDMSGIRQAVSKIVTINPSEALYKTQSGKSTLNYRRVSMISHRFESNGQ